MATGDHTDAQHTSDTPTGTHSALGVAVDDGNPDLDHPNLYEQLAPGVTVEVRDESWLVTNVNRTTDGFRIKVRGLSDYVRDTTATFFTALDDIRIFDPAAVTVTADNTPGFRRSKLWLESTLRQTPIPISQEEPEVATRMLADTLDYQIAAVRKALNPQRVQPRLLLADAVGLGKTLEIGMIVAELIRRGRGDRILVVTPKHVMEQFQQEMWTRFAIPLVRLDSQGIQKIRQKLPASKNPFTYFPRVIVSMDTLKSAKYKAQLGKVQWDIVVVDEIHNATNTGTQNNELIRTLAPLTDALILASATPHNGNPDSFKEILRLLDPLAVRPDGSIDEDAAKELIIRRHRHSPEVASIVGGKWAVREEPRNMLVPASPAENALAAELARTWVGTSLAGDLFPWTLVKAYLSSPAALLETIDARLDTLTNTKTTNTTTNTIADQVAALRHLRTLAAAITPKTSAKYQRLVDYLRTEVGINKQSTQRCVVFSERVATLGYLADNLTKDLKLGKGAVRIMHGGMSDMEQMELIDEFKRADTPLRVLITGDVASEGVNLHAQCHHLVHYDIPWSLIRIQQRNGRIDRYGQTERPIIATLLLDPETGIGETRVLHKLIDREHAAHDMLGDAASLMGQHSIRGEEEQIRNVLRGTKDLDEAVKTPEDILAGSTDDSIDSFLAFLATEVTPTPTTPLADAAPAPTTPARPTARSLYVDEESYLVDALQEAFHDVPSAPPARGGVALRINSNDTLELTPPADLRRRFELLPQDYVDYRKVTEHLMLATSRQRGESQLLAALASDAKSWPKAHFLGPLHPVTAWASDRALSSLSKSDIPAFAGQVDRPTALLMGTLTSARGQVTTRSFITAVTPFATADGHTGPASITPIPDPVDWLHSIGLTDAAISTGTLTVPPGAPGLIRAALEAAGDHMNIVKYQGRKEAEALVQDRSDRVAQWQADATGGTRSLFRDRAQLDRERQMLTATLPERTLIRPLAVILPADQ